jgi:nitroreductase
MEFFELIRSRRSIRVFERKPVEPEKVQKILDAATSAPSAGNLQAYEIIVVRDPDTQGALASAALNQESLKQAPVLFAFLADPKRSAAKYGQRGVDLYCVQDATVACTFAHLAAAALGLGSVWVGAFYDEAVSKALNAPPDWWPVALLAVGYPGEKPEARSRRPVAELARHIP